MIEIIYTKSNVKQTKRMIDHSLVETKKELYNEMINLKKDKNTTKSQIDIVEDALEVITNKLKNLEPFFTDKSPLGLAYLNRSNNGIGILNLPDCQGGQHEVYFG